MLSLQHFINVVANERKSCGLESCSFVYFDYVLPREKQTSEENAESCSYDTRSEGRQKISPVFDPVCHQHNSDAREKRPIPRRSLNRLYTVRDRHNVQLLLCFRAAACIQEPFALVSQSHHACSPSSVRIAACKLITTRRVQFTNENRYFIIQWYQHIQ